MLCIVGIFYCLGNKSYVINDFSVRFLCGKCGKTCKNKLSAICLHFFQTLFTKYSNILDKISDFRRNAVSV